ncbi:hypothetical protein T440DRAFT_221736 [Plenodomus tracheiphilus IPT5]|uniref:Uncharacterized protein n=1 Tax=Plenodomus tracheiphilus IPT5 TaxID=1408161 RepID=A0A6A7ATQ1_9PLEO|nr:hypothetical protein T440DRAFT_221736 [Plenodomus tracheiphilus IPT5]
MSSYGSNKSGFMHPQYHPQAPPYPPTHGSNVPPQTSSLYPPNPQPYQQQQYPTLAPGALPIPRDRRSSSTSSTRRPSFGIPIRQPLPQDYTPTSPMNQTQTQPQTSYTPQPQPQPLYPTQTPTYPMYAPLQPLTYPPHQTQPIYARSSSHNSHYSHHSAHGPHDHHEYADGEDKYEGGYDGVLLDEETEREYERRYARERAAERRPTLGGSVLSMVGKVKGILGAERR